MRLIMILFAAASLWAAPPQRIVSTAPSITETLFAMGLGPHVVGVTIYCKFPEEAIKLPKIGTYLKPDVEAIIAMHPDLVVVQRQPNHLGEQLGRLHVRYVEVESTNLNAVYEGARAIGKAADATAAAERLILTMQRQLREVQAKAASVSKPTVAFLVGHTAGRLEGLIAGAGKSYFNDILQFAGGSNVFSDAATAYPKVSLEEILSRNPDVILELSGSGKAKQEEVVSLWQSRPSLGAVSNQRVFALESGPFVTPGPRAVEAARIVLHLLHPHLPQSEPTQ
jgi:iron complex transport system substrate-binding protein